MTPALPEIYRAPGLPSWTCLVCAATVSPPSTLKRHYTGIGPGPLEVRTGPAVLGWGGERRGIQPDRAWARHRVTWMFLDRRLRPSRMFCARNSFRLPRRNFPSRTSLSLP